MNPTRPSGHRAARCCRLAVRSCALLGALGLAGCQSLQSSDNVLGVITPYRIEVVQGNVVTKEQASAVKPGMDRAQVRDVLGSPLLADIFHADRWDYVFTIRRQGTRSQSRTVVVLFDGDKLKSIESSGDLPTEREFDASIDTYKRPGKIPLLALTDEERKRLAVPPLPAPVDAIPDVAARSYPPLESSTP